MNFHQLNTMYRTLLTIRSEMQARNDWYINPNKIHSLLTEQAEEVRNKLIEIEKLLIKTIQGVDLYE